MQALYNWLIGNMGTAGEYQYQSIHLYSTLAVALVAAAAIFLGFKARGKEAAEKQLLKGICIFQLGFEVLWRLIYLLIKGDSILCWWPIYPCNLGGVLIPIFALTGCKTGKKMFYLFGFVGGVLTFALPEGIFSSDVPSALSPERIISKASSILFSCCWAIEVIASSLSLSATFDISASSSYSSGRPL